MRDISSSEARRLEDMFSDCESQFELTEEHLKLLQRMYVGWQWCETGAPEIDPKRPYGNSAVEADIAEILGFELFDYDEDEDYGEYNEEALQRAEKLHLETMIALQIVLKTQSFEPGMYRRTVKYNTTSWELVE